jgi:anti-sigma factor RsiW
MMNCNEARSLMSQALDGVLTERAVEEINPHVRRCAACYTHWQAMQHVSALFRGAGAASPPDDFTARVMQQVYLQQPRYIGRRMASYPLRTFVWATGAVAAMLAVVALAVAAPGVASSGGGASVSLLNLSMAVSSAAISTAALIQSLLAVPLRIGAMIPVPALALLALWLVVGTAVLGFTVGSLVAAYQPAAEGGADRTMSSSS